MRETPEHILTRKKNSTQIIATAKSPYFASVRRKQRVHNNSPYSNQTHYSYSRTYYPLQNEKKKKNDLNTLIMNSIENQFSEKKVFKRFKQFQKIEGQNKNKKYSHKMQKYTDQHLYIDTRRKSRSLIKANNTIAVINKQLGSAEKYSTYQSIPKLSPKAKQRHRSRKIVTKAHSKNSLAVLREDIQHSQKEEDWLCKQLIVNQVYAQDDQYDF